MRAFGRKDNELRKIILETNVNKYAEGSCMTKFGDTHVLCMATVEERVPGWLREKGGGWITAEYGMLPRSTGDRIFREASRGRQGGRTLEIQRLIGRSLRAVTNLKSLGECQIKIDCDVLQADGGTRTAAVTGGFVALYQACEKLVKEGVISTIPLLCPVAAVSCGIKDGVSILDLDYNEDSNAWADMNFVLTEKGQIVEIQGTAETEPFDREQLDNMLDLARKGINEIIAHQKTTLGIN